MTLEFKLQDAAVRKSNSLHHQRLPNRQQQFGYSAYHLSKEAEDFLARIQTPISVVTVAGLYRTGKSYLLNRVILNRSGGFGVGPTVNPCTKGLWIWNEGIKTHDKTLLVVDTEGLGALDEESNHDMKIFCLAVLLSSTFIYNSVGSIDETALQTLSLVLNLVNSIDRDSNSSRPNFLWIVRDFALQLVDQKGQNLTSKQYLQRALTLDGVKETQKIQLRKTIIEAFGERDCFTLVKPMIDETKLQNLDRVPEQHLRAEFVSQTMVLRKAIMGGLRQVKLNGSQALRGGDYITMIRRYLAAINNGKMPNLVDTWTFIREEKARQIGEQLKDVYSQKIRFRLNNKLPMPSARLSELVGFWRQELIEEFVRLSYEEAPSESITQWTIGIQAQLTRLNIKQTRAAFVDLLRKQFQPYQRKLISQYYAEAALFESDMRNGFGRIFLDKYAQRMDVAAGEVQLFSERRINEGLRWFQRKLRQEANRWKSMKEEVEIGLKRQIQQIGKVTEDDRRKYQQQIHSLQKRILVLGGEKQRAQEIASKIKAQQEIGLEKSKRRGQELQNMVEGLKQELIRLQSVNSELERNLFVVRKELQKDRALVAQKEQYFNAKSIDQERRIVSLQGEIQRLNARVDSERKQWVSTSEGKANHLSRELKEMSDHLHDTIMALEQEKSIRQASQRQLNILKNRHQQELNSYKQRLANSSKKQAKNYELEESVREVARLRESLQIAEKERQQWQLRAKSLGQQVKTVKINGENALAIHIQKIEFQQIQIGELRSKNVELNRCYQRYLETAHHDSKSIEETYARKMAEALAQNQLNLKIAEEDWERRLRDARREIQGLAKVREDLQLALNLQKKRAEDREKELKEAHRGLQESYRRVNERLGSGQEKWAESLRQKENYYVNRLRQLETEIQMVKERGILELQQNQRKTEEALGVVKRCAELERTQWQKRWDQQRQKQGRKARQQREQLQRKLREERQTFEGTLAELQDKVVATQARYGQQLQSVRYDCEIRLQKLSNQAMEEKMELSKRNALVSQQLELSRSSFRGQLEQRKRGYQQALDAIRRQAAAEVEVLTRKMKEESEAAESRAQSMKKSLRKTQQGFMILRAQFDKEKGAWRQKQQNYGRKMSELQGRLAQQLLNATKTIEEIKESQNKQRRKLNSQIQKARELLFRAEEQKGRLMGEHDQQLTALSTKNNYLQSKLRRSKEQYEDLLKKFQTTVRNFSNNQSKAEMQRQYEEVRTRMRQECERKIAEKEEQVHRQIKQYTEKILRLQTDNKTLRDKLLLFEMKISNSHPREQYSIQEVQRLKEQYERKISDLKSALDRERREARRAKEDRDTLQVSARTEKSRVSQKSERGSFLSEVGEGRPLIQNKSLLNRRVGSNTNIKKQDKGGRCLNIDTFDGIMRYQ